MSLRLSTKSMIIVNDLFFFSYFLFIITSTKYIHQEAIPFLKWYAVYHRLFPFPHFNLNNDLFFLGGQKPERTFSAPGHCPVWDG